MASADTAWRPIIAALANDDARPVLGALLAGDDATAKLDALSASRRRGVITLLIRAGLAVETDGRLTARTQVYRELLEAAHVSRPTGVERFLRDGRIDRWPSGAADRTTLLAWAADQALAPGETATESVVTERLAQVFDDPVALRRYLVDAGLLERRRDGSEYARPA